MEFERGRNKTMKLSRSIVNKMPTRTLDEVRKREAAAERLRETEAFVAEQQSLFENTIALDGEDVDKSPTQGVVKTSSEEGAEDSYSSSEILASNLGGSAHFLSTTRTATQCQYYARPFYGGIKEVSMESNPEKDRVTFKVRKWAQRYHTLASAKTTSMFANETPYRFVMVEGEGEDRVFRLEPMGTFERLWESALGLAGGLGGLVAPLKSYLPRIEWSKKPQDAQ